MMMSTLIYQQAMLLDNWTRASVIATVMIVTSYLVVGASTPSPINWAKKALRRGKER